MSNDRRVVHDPIHGSISLDGVFLDILDRHEIQRLHSIKQLGLGNMAFPGANHTRFEHSLGVYHLSGRMSDVLGLNDEDSISIRTAGFLHDICHPPFSHTLEELMERITGKDHMEIAHDLILGKIPICRTRDKDILGGIEPIASVLEDACISAEDVCDLIARPVSDMSGGIDRFTGDNHQSFFESKYYVHQIIHGPVDADQMDYLMRDAHYTGVTYGSIDIDRLLSQIKICNGKLALNRGGIVAAEGLMVSRSLMYSSVYYHKTVRIVEMMLTKAVEAAMNDGVDFSEIYLMTDSDLISSLIGSGGTASELARKVLTRRLYKKCYTLYFNDLADDEKAELTKYTGYEERKKLEKRIADKACVDESEVTVDIPSKSTLLSLEKIGKTDVLIDDGSKPRSITNFSPLARSLQSRGMLDWAILISAPKEKGEAVRAAVRNIIGINDRLSL